MMRAVMLSLALSAALTFLPSAAVAQMPVANAAALIHYNVTIRRFDPVKGPASGTDFVLPVDSPDEEHAIASTIANAASWPGKVVNGRPMPVAFMAIRVERR